MYMYSETPEKNKGLLLGGVLYSFQGFHCTDIMLVFLCIIHLQYTCGPQYVVIHMSGYLVDRYIGNVLS